MAAIQVDLYSDTLTRPSPAMRKAMAEAEVGNEQANEDPTVNKLCERVAELLGHEAGVFVPSGTMCNAISYRVYCRQGDEVILDKTAHPIHAEAGGPAALSGVMLCPVDGKSGIFTAEQLQASIRPYRRNRPRARLVSLEQTSNFGGGTIWPLETLREVCDTAHKNELKVHMDGARLMNAVIATGVSAKDYASPCDSAWLDLSKGLGCPVGAVLCGSADFIEDAWRWKHQFGGAMRQAGIIAAAGVYALDHNIERLAEDHANARLLAQGLAQIPGIVLDPAEIATNLVFFDVTGTGLTSEQVYERLLAKGIRVGSGDGHRMRAVTHLDVSRADIERVVRAMRDVVAGRH
ncbi:MAG: low specificity L-threonine aldolase [Alphaproteobacteria bacterium]|nr:low specificity L-threonine aldolase [Alphaproteobacteria bacterium]